MDEIRILAGMYLEAEISLELFEAELPQAMRKLEWIISREGDADGERLKPYYIAQLVAETIRADVLTMRYWMDFEDKKRAARKADNPIEQPHYSISERVCQAHIQNF